MDLTICHNSGFPIIPGVVGIRGFPISGLSRGWLYDYIILQIVKMPKAFNPRTEYKFWCFTWHVPDDYKLDFADVKGHCEMMEFVYLSYQLEKAPTTGKLHLQGFFHCSKPLRLSALVKIIKLVFPGAHLEPCRSNFDANEAYVGKEESRVQGPWSHGDPVILKNGKQGKRVTREDERRDKKKDLIASIRAAAQSGVKFNDWVKDELEALLGYGKQRLLEMWQEVRPRVQIKLPEKMYKWQQDVIDMVKQDASDRHVYWFCDPVTGVGKSTLVKWLMQNTDARFFTSADTKHIACAYNFEKIVCFNFAKDVDLPSVNYTAIEQLKDGLLFSEKYVSDNKVAGSPHVLCFANGPPRENALSADKWKIVYDFPKE